MESRVAFGVGFVEQGRFPPEDFRHDGDMAMSGGEMEEGVGLRSDGKKLVGVLVGQSPEQWKVTPPSS